MTVRRAVKTDLDKLLLLYQHLHTDDVQAADKVLVKVWNEILEDPSLAYFVIEMDGLIVTSCNLALIPNLTRAGRPIGLIENVVTHTDYRNLGLGKKVMQSAID